MCVCVVGRGCVCCCGGAEDGGVYCLGLCVTCDGGVCFWCVVVGCRCLVVVVVRCHRLQVLVM